MNKKKKNRILFFFAALSCMLILMTGCRQSASSSVSSEQPGVSVSEKESGAKTSKGETSTEKTENPKGEGQVKKITDMSGRTIEVPETIDKVFPTDGVAGIYLYTMDPDRLLGWNYDLNDLEKKIILPEYHDLPSFGMAENVNYEAVIAAGPQIALDVSSGDEASKANAEQLSESLGIPVVIVSDKLEDSAKVYRFLGELFGITERGEELAAFADKTFQDVKSVEIPEAEKMTIYYGNGENSLETVPRGSVHAQILDFVNAINVADMEVKGGSRVQISAEQLLAWDPDYIIVNGEPKKELSGEDAAQSVLNNPEFASLKAVKNGNVFGTPNTPFSWMDRPPGPNRLIGIRWLAKLVYPNLFEYDIDTEVKEFYKRFYHVDLTDEQLKMVYNQD